MLICDIFNENKGVNVKNGRRKNMKFETLKTGKFERFKRKIPLITAISLCVFGSLTFYFSHAKYVFSKSVKLAEGKITYKIPDFQTVAMYQQASAGSSTYNEITKMPTSGYHINETKSYCNLNSVKDTNARMYTNANEEHVFTGFSKGEKCFIYFDKNVKPLSVTEVLAKYTKNTSRSGSVTAKFTESTPTTVYSAADDNGTSYMFAGVNPNNWVKLGNLYFRIIRFNGDGTMRLIYSGEGSAQTSGTGTQIGTSKFNASNNDNMYVGLQYTRGQVHGTSVNSTILGESISTYATILYGWYNRKIKPNYDGLIDTNVGFCSDREPSTDQSTSNGNGGIGTTETYYGARARYVKGVSWQTNFTPTLSCKNASDNLKLPVGLITADEYFLAGGGSPSSSSYYNTTFWLHTGENYWTMSSYSFYSGYAYVFGVLSTGYLGYWNVTNIIGVRPVINLKSTTTFMNNGTGDPGTSTNPYEVIVN